MNKYFLSSMAIACIALSAQSCKDEKNAAETINQKEVAIEISQEKENVQFSEAIYATVNAEFCKGDYIQNLPQQMRMKRAGASESNDTITTAEEIPVISAVAITQKINIDGSVYYLSEDKTTDEMKCIETINVHPQPENERIAKTIFKDNVVFLYNSAGQLLKSEPVPDMNMKPILDSIQVSMATPIQNTSTAQRAKRSIAMQKASANGMRLVSESPTEVIMEMDLGTSNSSLSNKVKALISKKAIMRFSPDMSRMYSQKIYEGDQLTQLVEMEYASKIDKQFSNTAPTTTSALLPDANIKQIRRKTLMIKADGTPYILNNLENFQKNQVIYNFAKK